MKKIAVVGLGNILMGDDGIGVRVVEQLEREKCLSRSVTLIQGETAGITILPYIEDAEAVIFVDAVIFDGEYGEVKIFKDDEIQTDRGPPLSVHELGLKDVVSLIELYFHHKPDIALIGIKPKSIAEGLEISPEVEKSIPIAARTIMNEIEIFADMTGIVR
ncbi:MAG: hydrogenase maturation protease [Bacteroidetes bacterium]|nr:hydrogenase maturation protease [Bacteroidota bacterium]MCL5737445.1 hydrogenase maturation protease [Bacteroidota bacterium]